MTTNYPPDTGYIVGRPYLTVDGWATPGEPASEEVVSSGNLYALISAGFVYPYVPDKGYSYLPPHMYNAVRTYQEVNDIIAVGEAPIEMDWTPPKKLEEAQALVDAENESRAANADLGQDATEAWTRKLEETQISPRPVELPREQIFVDAKKAEAEDAADDEEAEGYASWTKAELQEELGNRELATSGNKAELVERLEEDDASK